MRVGSHDTLKPASASPFRVAGAPNVMLETVKRGEDDEHRAGGNDKATVILRLFEQFGGHAKATLKMSVHTPTSLPALPVKLKPVLML